ncbi:MAG: hypothetical protein ACKO4T_13570 [Planctomycetaceae bacterium]
MTDADRFADLLRTCAARSVPAMLDELATSLAARRRWHGLFDTRIIQARVAIGLPPVGTPGDIPLAVRDAFDERSLAACREAGWPLIDEGQVAAGWMYLRAAVEPPEIATRLAAIARPLLTAAHQDEEADRVLQEILGVVLWDAADPALGIEIVLATQGTCNAITAFEQAVSRLPASRQRTAAGVLVARLHADLCANLTADIESRGITAPSPVTLGGLLAALGSTDVGLFVDVSHLQSVLRIARVCEDEPTVRRSYELADYACRLPDDLVYPGEPPFENVGEASRLFYGSQLGVDVDRAIRFFRAAAATAEPEAGLLPQDVLVLLLSRLGRPAEALHAAVARPRDERSMPSPLQASAALPTLVDLAATSGEWELLRRVCRDRGDEITFAATLAAECQKSQGNCGPQGLHRPQGAER